MMEVKKVQGLEKAAFSSRYQHSRNSRNKTGLSIVTNTETLPNLLKKIHLKIRELSDYGYYYANNNLIKKMALFEPPKRGPRPEHNYSTAVPLPP
ncbi:hypothetical protein [Vibrio parahaemolyticus]|uniref:hypothetical protein n=1 Tax=Vibrio parahaemolyticus TaxID=670 RepID=UPI000993CA25|nr:hypothetical protein [Vibrio parahaemolyticus]MBE4097324.1 hypothetical protein [Vibrio parahaemolyticus]MBE4132702.1 hypothetical protein [Vibrio parahaemolyticus]MBX5339082.1 hypothetical protein [Vibrio parahaemolyticus]MCX4129186.1 hypothetical protein [Vibrio parahaemolyticus]MCX8823653.1 hypothetical protein [Vibrio parahaemolyticus]